MKKITPKTMLNEIMEINPDAVSFLFEAGMMCCGCPMAQDETLEEGCRAHGMSNKQIDDLIKRLNKGK